MFPLDDRFEYASPRTVRYKHTDMLSDGREGVLEYPINRVRLISEVYTCPTVSVLNVSLSHGSVTLQYEIPGLYKTSYQDCVYTLDTCYDVYVPRGHFLICHSKRRYFGILGKQPATIVITTSLQNSTKLRATFPRETHALARYSTGGIYAGTRLKVKSDARSNH